MSIHSVARSLTRHRKYTLLSPVTPRTNRQEAASLGLPLLCGYSQVRRPCFSWYVDRAFSGAQCRGWGFSRSSSTAADKGQKSPLVMPILFCPRRRKTHHKASTTRYYPRFQRLSSQTFPSAEATDYDTKMAQLQAKKRAEQQQQQMAGETLRRSEVSLFARGGQDNDRKS